jgi:hypothetical protein
MHSRRGLLIALAVLGFAVPGVAQAGPSQGDALVFRAANGDLKIFDSGSATLVRTLAPGVVTSDRRTLLTARVHGASTLLRRVSLSSGAVIEHRTIAGRWGFQQAAEDGTLVAGGGPLQPIALVATSRAADYRGGARSTRIAIVASDLKGPVHVVRLAGSFGVDDVSSDGSTLYLIQHVTNVHYRVRAYSLLTGKLMAGAIVDKSEPNEKMEGLPLARTESPDGSVVLTLYRRPSGVPFVHALMADDGFAVCIDLPASARVDPEDTSSWGIAIGGGQLFVANADTGWLAAIDYRSFKVLRTTSLGVQPATTRAEMPLAVDPMATKLYLARPQGLVTITASSLTPATPIVGRSFSSVALGSHGMLYATGGGMTETLDTATGAAHGRSTATGKLTLVSVVEGFEAG